jgi:hypothetical protein
MMYRLHKINYKVKAAFRRACCFSKKLFNQWKAFDTAFFYINYDFV